MATDAQVLGIPETFNAATTSSIATSTKDAADHVAIECGDDAGHLRASFRANVNRFAAALRDRLGVRPEERVLLLLLDGPEFVYAFFGAIKIGAVPIPINTLWKAADYGTW